MPLHPPPVALCWTDAAQHTQRFAWNTPFPPCGLLVVMGDQPLEQWGNATTHNLEAVLHTNIQASRYSKGLDSVVEFSELVDEIYSNVRGHRRCV